MLKINCFRHTKTLPISCRFFLWILNTLPNGTLKTGTSSPYGFSQSEDCFIYSGSDNTYSLNGWGNRNKGHWTSGTYRIEVWYENTCLKSKTFTIY